MLFPCNWGKAMRQSRDLGVVLSTAMVEDCDISFCFCMKRYSQG